MLSPWWTAFYAVRQGRCTPIWPRLTSDWIRGGGCSTLVLQIIYSLSGVTTICHALAWLASVLLLNSNNWLARCLSTLRLPPIWPSPKGGPQFLHPLRSIPPLLLLSFSNEDYLSVFAEGSMLKMVAASSFSRSRCYRKISCTLASDTGACPRGPSGMEPGADNVTLWLVDPVAGDSCQTESGATTWAASDMGTPGQSWGQLVIIGKADPGQVYKLDYRGLLLVWVCIFYLSPMLWFCESSFQCSGFGSFIYFKGNWSVLKKYRHSMNLQKCLCYVHCSQRRGLLPQQIPVSSLLSSWFLCFSLVCPLPFQNLPILFWVLKKPRKKMAASVWWPKGVHCLLPFWHVIAILCVA